MATAEATSMIVNDYGVLARQAMVLVYHANQFHSDIYLKANGKTVTAKSILMVESMAFKKEDEVTGITEGSDAEDAVAKIKEIMNAFEDRIWFDEKLWLDK